jgi:hypothetical protein
MVRCASAQSAAPVRGTIGCCHDLGIYGSRQNGEGSTGGSSQERQQARLEHLARRTSKLVSGIGFQGTRPSRRRYRDFTASKQSKPSGWFSTRKQRELTVTYSHGPSACLTVGLPERTTMLNRANRLLRFNCLVIHGRGAAKGGRVPLNLGTCAAGCKF